MLFAVLGEEGMEVLKEGACDREETICSSYSVAELRAIIRYERERRQKAEALVGELKEMLKEGAADGEGINI